MMNRKFNYTRNDVDYYLEAYSKIKKQLNIYLTDKLSSDDEMKTNNSNFNNSNENNIINKLSDYDFEKDDYAIKCVDRLEHGLIDVRDKKILKFRYTYKLTIEEVASEVCYHTRTVERRLQSMKDKLFYILNS
nr:MAG TPA: Sigma factor AlgU negative regulatory factor, TRANSCRIPTION.96A [Caudoviricetes sp.]